MSNPTAELPSTRLAKERIKRTLYIYLVTYSVAFKGESKTTKQQIQSTNPEANFALGQEALGLLVDVHKGQLGADISIISIQGITDKNQTWPPRAVQSAETNETGSTGVLEGLSLSDSTGGNLELKSTNPDDALTANGLPTPAAAEKFNTEKLRELGLKLGVPGVLEMKYPELRKVVLAGLSSALKASA